MDQDWYDKILGGSSDFEDNSESGLYCPYTNCAECMIITKGLQPQELCETLECEQLKLVRRMEKHNRGHAA